jgi:tRNA A37 threonylcarbamoyladenosine biosynthesis protein TsaE
MYGKRLQTKQLYSIGSVTHLRDATGRSVHVVEWSREQIDKWKQEQQAIYDRIQAERKAKGN